MAPKRAGRADDIRQYKSDEYLDESFRGALAKFGPEALAPRGYPRPTGGVEEARAATRQAIDAFFLAMLAGRGDVEGAHVAAE